MPLYIDSALLHSGVSAPPSKTYLREIGAMGKRDGDRHQSSNGTAGTKKK